MPTIVDQGREAPGHLLLALGDLSQKNTCTCTTGPQAEPAKEKRYRCAVNDANDADDDATLATAAAAAAGSVRSGVRRRHCPQDAAAAGRALAAPAACVLRRRSKRPAAFFATAPRSNCLSLHPGLLFRQHRLASPPGWTICVRRVHPYPLAIGTSSS